MQSLFTDGHKRTRLGGGEGWGGEGLQPGKIRTEALTYTVEWADQ